MNTAPLTTTQCLSGRVAEESLVRRVRQFLQMQQPTLLRRIVVAAEGGIVAVQGTVRSFYERQLAISCIRRVAGVRRVVDLLVVMEEVRALLGCPAVRCEVLP